MTIIDEAPPSAPPPPPPAPRPRTDARSPSRPAETSLLTTELALVALSVVGVVGLVRIFSGGGYLVPALGATLVAHVLAAFLRRRRVPGVAAVAVGLGALALFAPIVLYLSTTRFGLPGGATWDAMAADLREAWDQFGVVKAPTEALDGFVLAIVAGSWIVALAADAVAFRLAGTWEALVPAGSLFVFTSALAGERYRLPVAVVFLVGCVVFVLAQRGLQAEGSPGWLNPGQRPLSGVLLRAGGGALVLAVGAAALLAPTLPGAGDRALLDAYDGGDDNSRVTLSPLVDIRGRLTNQSDVEAFAVQATAASYWRLTALDEFDGRIWSSNNRVRSVDGPLPGRSTEAETRVVEQTFTIGGLDVIWLPAAYRPVSIDAAESVSYDTESGSLVTGDSTAEGQTYVVRSEVPDLSAADLAAVPGAIPNAFADRYLALPDDFPVELQSLAIDVTQGATSTYDRARRLQDWFRTNFTYDLTVDAGHGDDAISRFLLETRAGYCEQFAGSFAALARSLGIPSRVAVGFTPGEETAPGTFVVRGRNAHAWPEVWFVGIGWVPFEPTPQRGIPGASDYTGVAAEQEPSTPTTVSTATTLPTDPSATALPQLPDDLFAGDIAPGTSSSTSADDASPWPGRLLAALAVLATAVLLAASIGPLARRVRRQRRAGRVHDDADRVRLAWADAEEALGRSGVRTSPADTPREVAARAVAARAAPAALLEPLARDATAAQWDPAGVAPERVVEARERLAALEAELHAPLTVRERIWRHVDPRAHRSRPPSWRRAVTEPEHGRRH